MLCQSEKGVLSGSDFYFFTPSAAAREKLFYFTSIGHFFCDFGYRVTRQEDYGNYMLLLVKKGKLMVTAEGKTAPVNAGDMAFMNCHLPHEYYAVGFTEFLWIHFEGSNTARFHDDITYNFGGQWAFHLDHTESIEAKLREIISHYRYEKKCSEFEDSLNIYELLIDLSQKISAGDVDADSTREQVIDDALEYINENLGREMTVRMIADSVGMSESHFSRKFRKSMNSSPKEYLIRRRLTEAKRLLKTTTYTVKEIAFLVGFNSESHFVNTFSAQIGLSPKKFRDFPL